MLLTDSPTIAEKIRDLRDYDNKDDYRLRMNAKMSEIEAAIGNEQLKKLSAFVACRRDIARIYDRALRPLPVRLPPTDANRDHVYFCYVIRVSSAGREHWLSELGRAGVEAKRPVYKALHQYLRLPDKEYPVASQAMLECCSLPIFPALPGEDVTTVIRCIKEVAVSLPTASRQL